MSILRVSFFALLLSLPLAACGQDQADTAPVSTSETSAPPATMAEDSGNAVARSVEQDTSSEAAKASVPTSPTAKEQAAQYVEGKHYVRLQAPVATRDPSQVEVVEVFSYACPHCYAFEDLIDPWVAQAPQYVDFHRVPAIFNQYYLALARAFYTAKSLGVLDATHSALFDAIHKEGRRFRSQEDLAQFYAGFGVNPESFLSTGKSFPITNKLQQAQSKAQAYGVKGVPTLIVNGKYRVSSGGAIRSHEELLKVVDYLVAKEHRTLQGAAAE